MADEKIYCQPVSDGSIVKGRSFGLACRAILLCIVFGWVIPSSAEEIRRQTYDGIPLDEPIQFRVLGVSLNVPAGYLVPWPTPAMRRRVNETPELFVEFWMPSKRYSEISPLSRIGFRPKERGRNQPPPDAYIVRVQHLRPRKLDDPNYVSPEQRFKNLTSVRGRPSYSLKEEEFGLVRFWDPNWPYANPEPFTNYRHLEGSDPQIILRCTPPHKTSLNPNCDGYVHFIADELSFYLFFALQDLPRWRESVIAVRDLFKSWAVDR